MERKCRDRGIKAEERFTTKEQVEAYFHGRVRTMLAKWGKSTIGWDEMLDGPQPSELIIQSWRTSNPVSTATARGHRVIVFAGYLSMPRPKPGHEQLCHNPALRRPVRTA